VGPRLFSDQQIAQYLLGSSTDAEHLDELSFTDDEFAARLQSVENDLVDAYARGELSGQALENFNVHYLSSPHRRNKVLIALGIKDALSPEGVKPALTKSRKPLWNSRGGFFLVPNPGLQIGLTAALLLILATAAWLSVSNLRLRQQANQSQTELVNLQRRERELHEQIASHRSVDSEKTKELTKLREQIALIERKTSEQQSEPSDPGRRSSNIVSFALGPQLRGAGQISMITVPQDADYLSLKLDLETSTFPAYRAELKTQPGNQMVWKSGRLLAGNAGTGKVVVVTLPAGLLKAQRYIVELSGMSSDGKAEVFGRYLFEVTRP
jgi:hypothetical protein